MESLRAQVVHGWKGLMGRLLMIIEIAKKIANDYEHGFERTKDEKACGECGYRLYCGD